VIVALRETINGDHQLPRQESLAHNSLLQAPLEIGTIDRKLNPLFQTHLIFREIHIIPSCFIGRDEKILGKSFNNDWISFLMMHSSRHVAGASFVGAVCLFFS
jgi:hypothetical protein